MTRQNLAVVFAPSLLKLDPREQHYTPALELQQLPLALRVTQCLISEYPRLFCSSEPESL